MINEIERTFVVPSTWLRRQLPKMLQVSGTLNASKIGRTRRGGWLMTGFSGEPKENGTTVVSMRMQKAPRMAAVFYRHDDIGKVLKDLTVAAKKAKVTHD